MSANEFLPSTTEHPSRPSGTTLRLPHSLRLKETPNARAAQGGGGEGRGAGRSAGVLLKAVRRYGGRQGAAARQDGGMAE